MKFIRFKLLIKEGYQIIEILVDNEIYDLHNASEFKGFDYDVATRTIKLGWLYYNYDKGIPEKEFNISCKEVTDFEVAKRDADIPYSEDDVLSEILFEHNKDTISFKFMGGQTIKIHCATCELDMYPVPVK
jgi:hypothetical protein